MPAGERALGRARFLGTACSTVPTVIEHPQQITKLRTRIVKMQMKTIDFRSDFLSTPTLEMQAAMQGALAEGCGFAFSENVREKDLETYAAEVLGKESALLCATCSLATQIAINVASRPGDAVITEARSHIVTSEAGTAAAFSGVMMHQVPGTLGVMDPERVASEIMQGSAQGPRTSLIVIENTHVRTGGRVVPMENMVAIAGIAREAGVRVHLDGSRIFNAATYLGVSAKQIADQSDSVSISLNKGLAAPQGAILAGSRDFIAEAVRVRQMFGGGWRPAPTLCSAGLVALQTMPQRLHRDHENAERLANGLSNIPGLSLAPEARQTNLVLIDLIDRSTPAEAFAKKLELHGIKVLPFGAHRIRLALYHDISSNEVDRTIDVMRSFLDV